jgi:drug/metabolite transporter (DMT)-like permease
MAMAVGGRELSTELGTFEILFFRSLIGVFIVGALLLATDIEQAFRRAHRSQPRSLRWPIRLVFWDRPYTVGEVFAIEFTVPVWTAILAPLLLSERLTRGGITAIVLGFIGRLIILRPGIAVINPAALVVLAGAVGYALSHTLTRRLALADTPLCILFYMTVIQLPLGLIPAIADWVTPSMPMWPWLFVVGITALSAHYCSARALAIADATVVVPLDFLRLPLIALVGFLFDAEALDWFVLGGAMVMLVGNLSNIWGEQAASEKRSDCKQFS